MPLVCLVQLIHKLKNPLAQSVLAFANENTVVAAARLSVSMQLIQPSPQSTTSAYSAALAVDFVKLRIFLRSLLTVAVSATDVFCGMCTLPGKYLRRPSTE